MSVESRTEPARGTLLGSALVLMWGRTIAYAGGFLVPVILVRQFPPAEFGTYKQVFLLYETCFFIAQLGLANSLFYFLPGAAKRSGRYIANALLLLAASGVLFALPLVGGDRFLRWLFGGSTVADYAAPVALYLLFMMVAAPLEIFMISNHRVRLAAYSYAFGDVLRAALLIVPAVVTRDLRWVIYGAVAFALARAIATALYFRRQLGGELRPDAGLARAQLAYSLPFALAVVFGTIQLRLHEFVVAHTFDAATFAIYAVGCLQIPFIDFISSPASNVMMVRMAEARADSRGNEVRANWFDTVRGLALVFFPFVALLLLGAPELIVLLFTSAYAASIPIFRLWSLTILLVPFLTDAALRVFAETRFLVLVNLAQLVVLAVTIGPLLALWGLPGAVLATGLAMLVGRGISLLRIRRRLEGEGAVLPWRQLGLVLAAAALATPFGMAAKWVAGESPIPVLLACGLVYMTCYALLIWRWGLAPEANLLLRQVFARFLPPAAPTEAGAG